MSWKQNKIKVYHVKLIIRKLTFRLVEGSWVLVYLMNNVTDSIKNQIDKKKIRTYLNVNTLPSKNPP
jgi:hypothetical protein